MKSEIYYINDYPWGRPHKFPYSQAQLEFRQIFPQSGWVEHDALEIWHTTYEVIKEAINRANVETSEIAGGTLADIKADAAKFYFVDNEVKPGTSSAKELEFPVEFDATVTVVLGADGAGQFAVSDGTAGIYVYSNKTAVKVGDKVHVKGSITVYYGTLQVGANIEVTPATFADQTIEFKSATPTSINAMSTADGMYGGQTLNVSGTLLFGKYNNGSSDSFWLEDAQTGSQIELYYKSFTAAEKEALQAYAGKFVEMNVVTYDTYSSSAPNDHRVFAIPSTVKEATAPEVTDADKLAAAVAKANAASLKDVYYNLNYIIGSTKISLLDQRSKQYPEIHVVSDFSPKKQLRIRKQNNDRASPRNWCKQSRGFFVD